MAWGGSLNKDGSDYVRKLKEIEKVLHFLEEFKASLVGDDRKKVIDVIEIIVNHFQQENNEHSLL
jgi:hypothetical protein